MQVIGTVVGGLLLLGCLKLGGLLGAVEWQAVGRTMLLGLVVAYGILRIGIKVAENALAIHLGLKKLGEGIRRRRSGDS